MHWLIETLRAHPEIALFLTLALGYGLTKLRLGPIQLNAVVAVLIAGVAVGQLRIDVPSSLQWVFFVLFLFSIGYQTGPQFFRGLGRSALPQVGLAILLCGMVLASALALSKLFGFNAGAGAGLLAGGMNASAAIGTAGDAIARLPADPTTIQTLSTSLAVAFAVTYLVGLLTEIFTLTTVGPWLMRADLAAECKKLETAMGIQSGDAGATSAYQGIVVRGYTVSARLDGQTVGDVEQSFAPARVFAEALRTPEGITHPAPTLRLRTGDVLALSGRLAAFTDPGHPLAGTEVDDPELLNIPTGTVDVVVAADALVGKTLEHLAQTIGREERSRSVFVRHILRGGKEVPFGPRTVIERGDVVGLVGPAAQVAQVAPLVGHALPPASSTDFLSMTIAIALGGLGGLATVRLGGLDVGLSMPVGVLLGGLVAGWLHSVRPAVAGMPEPVLRVFDSIGLTGFLAVVGINAGPGFITGLATSGVPLVAAGVLVCLLPNVVTILVGRYLLHINPGVLMGICAGAGTSPAGLAAVQEKAKSKIPTLGYGVSYAVGNLLLALCGSVVVMALRN
jgi:putative transport protein